MASGGSGTDQVLAVESACGDEAQGASRARQAPLDHRAGLSGTQARVGTEPIRGAGLAGFSPSRHTLHRSIWVPGRREEPFFPLRASRPDTNIPARAVCAIPPARGARYGPSGIIRNRSPRCDTRSPTTCCISSTPAFFAAPHFYNTVVLAARGKSVHGRKRGTTTNFRFSNPF